MVEYNFGPMNEHALGIVLKDLLRRGMTTALEMRTKFTAHEKTGEGKVDDWFTTADTEAQRIIAKSVQECLPGWGILAEEAGLRTPCMIPGKNYRVSIDPIDGTKAYIRGQSHGIGTMMAVADYNRIIAAFVGDVMTGEFYYYRPGSMKVHRMSDIDHHHQTLTIDSARPLSDQYILLRDRESRHSPLAQKLFAESVNGGKFKNLEVTGGSIGISMARLWKGEVGGALLLPCREHAWDYWPVFGISQRLGFRWLRPEGGVFRRFEMPVRDESWDRDYEILVIHESRIQELVGE